MFLAATVVGWIGGDFVYRKPPDAAWCTISYWTFSAFIADNYAIMWTTCCPVSGSFCSRVSRQYYSIDRTQCHLYLHCGPGHPPQPNGAPRWKVFTGFPLQTVKFILPQPVGGPSKRKNPGALGTCPVCPLVKTALIGDKHSFLIAL